MMSKLKIKLQNREPVAGTHVFLKDPCISEMFGALDYDCVWIDTEHTAMDLETVENHLRAVKAGGGESIVRVQWNDPIFVKRILEMGPTGILFPTINTPEELDLAVRSTLYPPEGIRGFGPMRAIRYGIDDSWDYTRRSNKELVRFSQIESYIAVENMAEMVKNPYVDCFIFGPNDLSASIGRLGEPYCQEVSDLIDEAIRIIGAAGKSIGVATGDWSEEVVGYWHNKGINCIFAGLDYLHLLKGAQEGLATLHKVQGR